MDTLEHVRLVVIGGGVMGRAIVEGGVRAGVLDAAAVVVAEPDARRRAEFESLGVGVAATGVEALTRARENGAGGGADGGLVVLLAVKPQMFEAVAGELALSLASSGRVGGDGPMVVSIMAGTRAAAIRERLGGAVRVVRAMPNTPARIGQGVTGIAGGPGATEADLAVAERLFRACGPVVVRIDEGLMDAFTAVAGSGPAYLFYLAEAMERAAAGVGFDGQTARAMVGQTIRGAAALLEQGADPAALRAAVTSKGGTTAAATGSLDRDGVAEAVGRAIAAGRDRGRELAGGG